MQPYPRLKISEMMFLGDPQKNNLVIIIIIIDKKDDTT